MITQYNGEQEYFDCVDNTAGDIIDMTSKDATLTACDYYKYLVDANGDYADQEFENAAGSLAFKWDQSEREFQFYDNMDGISSEDPTTTQIIHPYNTNNDNVIVFGSRQDYGYVQDANGRSTLRYDKTLKEFIFWDNTHSQYGVSSFTNYDNHLWYLSEFAWGKKDFDTWYLKGDFHDYYIQTEGFWA